MEKTPNKYAMIVRIMCYIFIPILILSMLQSILSIAYFANHNQRTETNNYFETQQFSDAYMSSILNNISANYTYYTQSGYEIGPIDISYLEMEDENALKEGKINYKTYLENRNFKFLLIDNKTNTAFTNLVHTMKTDTIDQIKQELANYSYYWNWENHNITTNIEQLSLENIKYTGRYEMLEQDYDCTIYTGIQNPLVYYDDYYNSYIAYEIAQPMHETAFINLPICFVLMVLCILLIGVYTGRKKGEKEIYLNWFDKIPLEVAGTFLFIFFFIALFWCFELFTVNNMIAIIVIISIMGVSYIIGMVGYETLVKRIKSHTLWRNTLLYRLINVTIRGTKKVFNNFGLATKIAFVIIAFILIVAILIHCDFIGGLLLVAIGILVFKYTFTRLTKFIKIKETVKQLYEGNTQVRLEETEYEGVLKELCIYLNDIAGGFTNAIEKSLKSERMKTELITNVSHDIKTPLTSIINYVDLLKKEEMPNEKAKEYLEILDKKSQRLKRLTEDLVEASKASSGNIKLTMERLDVKELLKQVSGEFEDKLKEKKLELIISMPEEDTIIIADSRYLYRVMENMYSNIVKYALPDSRVYVDIIHQGKNIEIQLKNISKDKLNITADELMERFVRGESSRNTEGSGLGLSIAQSLTELQKGTFNIYLDGDLFKVTITFEKKS